MSENQASVLFQAKRSNSLAILKSMNTRGLISHKTHFDLWLEVIKAKNHEDLDRATAEIFEVYREKGGL